MPRLYFAYGSNLNLEQMARRCPDSRPIRAHNLKGFQMVLRGVANIEEWDEGSAPGAIYEISESDEKTLDKYEDFPTLYIKKEFVTDIGTVMYYRLAKPEYKRARNGYVKVIEVGYKEWKLPLEHLERAIKAERERDS